MIVCQHRLFVTRSFVQVKCILALLLLNLNTVHAAYLDATPSGVRSMALAGAARALGESNDALILNPAGMALFKRYHVELQYGFAKSASMHHLAGTVVDSKSTAKFAGGAGYIRDFTGFKGQDAQLGRWLIGVGYPITDKLALGLTASYINGSYTSQHQKLSANLFNVTLGSLWAVGSLFKFAVVCHNCIPSQSETLRSEIGLGTALTTEIVNIVADTTIGLRNPYKNKMTAHVGSEVFLLQLLALRLGYNYQQGNDQLGQHLLSGGLAIIRPEGAISFAASGNVGKDVLPAVVMLASMQFYLM